MFYGQRLNGDFRKKKIGQGSEVKRWCGSVVGNECRHEMMICHHPLGVGHNVSQVSNTTPKKAFHNAWSHLSNKRV